ncbi:hypothetical protein LY76DRAFT_359425 [Colletotrichum caudatum]|nr:hypothetical protein LY76DRAFT_359425 [Colletotrichum caudatum]
MNLSLPTFLLSLPQSNHMNLPPRHHACKPATHTHNTASQGTWQLQKKLSSGCKTELCVLEPSPVFEPPPIYDSWLSPKNKTKPRPLSPVSPTKQLITINHFVILHAGLPASQGRWHKTTLFWLTAINTTQVHRPSQGVCVCVVGRDRERGNLTENLGRGARWWWWWAALTRHCLHIVLWSGQTECGVGIVTSRDRRCVCVGGCGLERWIREG